MVHTPAHIVNSSKPLPSFQKKRSCKYKIAFILCQGGTAVDAVEAAVRSLEDDPTFDAGHGSVLTEELTVEVDAMIMDGNTLESGKKVLCSLVWSNGLPGCIPHRPHTEVTPRALKMYSE